mmetsp:Transcript_10120/g.61551  ORF Transcript_10120/g.61551 Transcript_10120/m.61551 type:complete len:160 (-) Transcript_10120:533-1012(-)
MAEIAGKPHEGALMEISQDSHIASPLILSHVNHEHARFWKGIEKLYNMSPPRQMARVTGWRCYASLHISVKYTIQFSEQAAVSNGPCPSQRCAVLALPFHLPDCARISGPSVCKSKHPSPPSVSKLLESIFDTVERRGDSSPSHDLPPSKTSTCGSWVS